MKNSILFLSILLTLIGCMQPLEKTSSTQHFKIRGSINGNYGTYIKIAFDGKTDSSLVQNNAFEFDGSISSPTAFQFQFDSISKSEDFYLEADTLFFDIIVDEEKIDNDVYSNFEVKHIEGGNTPSLKRYLNNKLESFTSSKVNRNKLFKTMDSLIRKHPNHDYLGKQLSHIAMQNLLNYGEVNTLLSKMDVDQLNPKDVELLKNYQNKRKSFQIGSQIPNYTLKSETSANVKLHDALSQYTLLQFWNSWCEVCRQDIPNLKQNYRDYNPKGFEIISISLDANQDDWTEALADEDMPWKPLRIEQGFTGRIPTEMGIVHLPQYYLVDKRGRIIDINLSPEELNQILVALLN